MTFPSEVFSHCMLKTNLAVTGYLTLAIFFSVLWLYDWNNKWKTVNNEWIFKRIIIHTKLLSDVGFCKHIKIPHEGPKPYSI